MRQKGRKIKLQLKDIYAIFIILLFSGTLSGVHWLGVPPMGEIRVTCHTSEYCDLDKLEPLQGHLKKRTSKDLDQIEKSILQFGIAFPFFYSDIEGHWYILDGHGRKQALLRMRERGAIIPQMPIVRVEAASIEEAKQLLLRCESRYGVLEIEGFREFIDGLEIEWGDLALPSGDLFQFPDTFSDTKEHKSLSERFIIPPLSVFRVASGYWQQRKKAWLSLGIQSEKGRDDGMLKNLATLAKKASGSNLPSESIFDPVLCEIMYRWFCPPGGQILDPFAGGSVRGIIAGCLDYNYIGIDLRKEQIEANYSQAEIVKDKKPTWICGDSREMETHLPQGFECDFVFSCPPYADLEVYSNQPEDLSNMEYSKFRAAYGEIIKKACSRLRDDSFACFVVGEARSKSGPYYGLVPDTVNAFEDAGLHFYDEMILVTQIAAKALTVAEGFVKSRKIGKIHQNILVFVKGDPVKAATKCKIDRQELVDAISDEEKAETEDITA
jgi:DNA modification methylase